MRRSARNQSAVELETEAQRQMQANTPSKNKVVDVKKPKKLAATDSIVKLKGSSDDETENKPAVTPRRSRRNSERPQERPSSSSLEFRNTPSKSTPRRATPIRATPPSSTSKPAAPATKATKATPVRSITRTSTPVSADRAKARAQMAEDAEGEPSSSSSSSSSSSDEERHASDYSKSDSGEEDEIEADKSDDDDVHVDVKDEILSSDDDTDTRKRRRGGVSATPRKNKSRIMGNITPSAKRNLQQRRAANSVRPLPAPAIESLNDTTDRDAVSLSRALLHVGATPGYLPCREDEYLMIEGCIESLLEDGQGGCVCTGKTATVHSVIRGLIDRSNNQEISPFKYVEINGLRVSEPARAYPILWEGLTNDAMSLSPRAALNALERYYGEGQNDQACVLLMDELDQMVTSKQSEVYNFFNWPNMPRSKLIVVAVANTMDLPERVLRGKVKSRLGMERINFAPYDRMQLIEIVQSRLRYAISLAEQRDYSLLTDEDTRGLFDEDAVKIAAAKTASVQGDARRMLEVCRQTLERAALLPVKTSNVQQTLKAMSLSPLSRMMANLSLSAKIMLVCAMRCAAAAGMGTGECRWGDVSSLHQKLSSQLVSYTPVIPLSRTDQYQVLSNLAATRIVLAHEPGAPNYGLNKGSDAERMIILNVPEADVRRVLDSSVEDLLGRSNSISTLSDLLRPFDVLHNVPLRTSLLETHHAPSFYLRFNELAQLDADADELHSVVENAANDALDVHGAQNPLNQYDHFVDAVLSHHDLLPYSTFHHPAAFILATTTTHSDPIAQLARLAQQVSLPDAYAKRTYMNATPNYVLRYYVLIHDSQDGSISMDGARELLEKAKRAHGIHCAMLIINSKDKAGVHTNDDLVARTYGNASGHSLDASDLTVVRAFVRELVVQSLIPWMEKCTRDWNQLFVANRKGFANKLFSSFGVSRKWTAQQSPAKAINSAASPGSFISSEKIYPSTTHEATFRRLADFAFMLRDYKLSAQVYSQTRRDVAEEPEAYHYAASANEMLGLSHLLSPHSPTSTLDLTLEHLKEASRVWGETGEHNDSAQAVRATILFVESFRARGSSGLVIPAALIGAASGGAVHHAIMLSEAALAYENHVRPYKRKACLYYARAASLYEANGKLEHARWCYSHCDTRKFPFVVQALGRLASESNKQEAANLFTEALRYDGDEALLDNWRLSVKEEGVDVKSLSLPFPFFDKSATVIYDQSQNSTTSRRSEAIFSSLEQTLDVDSSKPDASVDVDAGETFHVQIFPRNPFHGGITLSDLELNFDGDGRVDVERLDNLVELAAMQALPLTFKCSIPTPSAVKLSSVSFTLDGLARFTESLTRNGRRLNDTKEQRIGRFYAPDLSLQVRAHEASPKLSASLVGVPQRMGLGEGRLAHLVLNNTGLLDVDDIRVAVNEQSFVVLGVDGGIDSALDFYKQQKGASNEKCRVENNLLPTQPLALHESIRSGEKMSIPVLVRGDGVGKRALHLLITYKQKDRTLQPSTSQHERSQRTWHSQHSVKRLLHIVDIRPVVDVKLAAHPSKAPVGGYELSLEIENVVPDSQVDITQVTFVSPAWKCVGDLQEMSLSFEEMVKQHFRAELSEEYVASDGYRTQEYMVDRMATYLQGKDMADTHPPPVHVLATHLANATDEYIPFTQTSLLNIMMNARRNLRQITLAHEFKSLHKDLQPHLFPLMEMGEGDVMVCWRMGDRVGHALVSGLVMGAREGLTGRIAERVKQSKDVRSVLYASTIKERERTLVELSKSRYNVNDMPIIVNTYTPSTINHLFEQEPELRLSVDVSLFNNSISKEVECTLSVRDKMEGLTVPTRIFERTVQPQQAEMVNIPLVCTAPGVHKLREMVLSLGTSNYVVKLNDIVVI
ncbi:hypothetical protein E3P98_01011 [Wallemia ichthyophaga]|nr:hypothetical protein E3P98_01011 [Wallemia ichthyophaga]